MNESDKKKSAVVAAFALFLAAGIAYIAFTNEETQPDYETPPPEKVVEQYFTAWHDKNYPDMYAAISDGFKKIEPTANDLRAFKSYAESQKISNARVLSVNEVSNDGKTAAVSYSVEFLLAGGTKSRFDGTFTLKYREGDVIPGWKLIHPYGENIDAS